MKRVVVAGLVAGALLFATRAHAFSTGGSFDQDPLTKQGGGGIMFDGAPRFTAHTCEVCHTNAPHLVSLRLESDDPSIFEGGWSAGKQYHMRVVLLNEHAAADRQSAGDNCGFAADPYTRCDYNGFTMEIDDLGGHPVGTYVPVSSNACFNTGGTAPLGLDSVVISGGTGIAHNGSHAGMLSWDFCWTAPPAGTGALQAYIAAVDGNGGDGTMNFPSDTLGDDVATGQVPIDESGTAPPPPQTGGCSAGGDAGGGALIVLALLALGLRGRTRRQRRLVAALAVTAIASGCIHVRPRERETLAKRNMKFSPDPQEDELDLHMQEAREGSSGGYGSAGGGCGCN